MQQTIPHFKKGKKLYFKKSDLIKWLEKGKRMSQAEIEEVAHEYLINKRK